MSTANPNKLKIKDIITVVLLALINVVIFFASSVLYATPITIILMPVFFALLEGIVLLHHRHEGEKARCDPHLQHCPRHYGADTCRTSSSLFSPGAIAELLLWKMGYGNAKALTVSYVINQVLAAFGSTIIPYAIAAKAMADQMVTGWPSGRHPCLIPDAAVLGIRGTGGRCDRGRIHRSSYRQGHREEASGCLICLGGITHESEHEAKALRRLVAGRAGKRAVRRVRFERPYGAAGRCLLAYSVFHHHPAYHRTGKRHGGASPLPDALRMDGGLLGTALCAHSVFHLSLPPCDVPCAGQYPASGCWIS